MNHPTHPFRDQVQHLWTEKIHESGELDAKAIAKQLADYVRNDPDMMKLYLAEHLVLSISHIGERTIKKMKGIQRVGTSVETLDHLRARVKAESLKVTWIEFDPITETHMPLLDMTRDQVTHAAAHRAASAKEHAEVSRWLLSIAERLEGNQIVGDVLTDIDIHVLRSLASAQAPNRTRKA